MFVITAIGCVFLAAACQTALGFGFALILVPLLSIFWSLKAAIIVSLLLSPVSSLAAVVELRRHTRWRVVGGLFAGSWLGVPVGAALLILASPGLLRLLVASTIVLSTLVTLFGVSLGQPRRPMLAAVMVGAISGALRSATSMGGPPVALYLLGMRYPATAFVGTSASFYLLGGAVSIAALAIAGRVTEREITIALVGVPALLVGVWFGRRIRARLSEHAFRALAAGLLLATSGTILAPFLIQVGKDLGDRL